MTVKYIFYERKELHREPMSNFVPDPNAKISGIEILEESSG
jgi:hypothetical protein